MTEKEKMEFDKESEELNENPFAQDNQEEEKIEKEAVVDNETVNNELEQLKSKCQGIEDQLEAQKSQYVRLAADFDNYRKRQAQERESLLKYGAEDTMKKLLPILDTIERAQKSFEELDDPQQLKESFEAIQKQLSDSLEKIGLSKIETVGKEFDPNIHEAVMQTPTNDHPDHSIIVELQSGYQLHDRVVRPAMVNVAVEE